MNTLQHFNRPKPVAWFFFLLAFSTCMAAGTWQVKRLQWKETLIATIVDANEHAPITQLPTDAAELEPLQFRKATIKGRWNNAAEFHLAPRYWRDKFGYWIITPFTLNDGRTILVNRGWIPGAKKDIAKRPETKVSGSATLNGLIRVGAERSYFTPESQAEKNVWFGRDIADMAAYAKLDNTIPAMFDLVGEQSLDKLPIPSDGVIRLRNDHLSYVITWYGIGLGVLVIFVTYHRKKKPKI